ncbi:F510_1955 family glycosylhydrolase [Alkalicoccus halolimnae]|uniref:YCF48-related protein n=1 Tax=Alkalicoccus halolimnae TaxID=1667239 RepID=A0A5C7FIW0_9BACI|nr:YCF48-related protein [Alkalicoccus halolimnae]TXF86069.1 hypothetical protein FTX54_05470 [Alkalicoccus halolimnae]
MKKWLAGSGIFLLISGCAGTNEETEDNEGSEGTQKQENSEAAEDMVEIEESGIESISHIHGLEFDRENPDILYAATHHGVVLITEDGVWNQPAEAEHQHDLMGFAVSESNRMVSSGHPSHDSDLGNPLGFMESSDRGETWEQISLQGEVDFHLFNVNQSDPDTIYGIDGMGNGMMKSEDGGETWEIPELDGLDVEYPDIYALLSDPENPERVLIGASTGIYVSEDGGEAWEAVKKDGTITSAAAADGKLYGYLLEEQGSYLAVSNDFGETWEQKNLSFEEDAALHLAIHPEDSEIIAVATGEGDLLLTRNDGESWETLAEAGERQ